MDDAVACWDISRRDRGTIDHDRGSNGERQRVSIDGSRRHAVRDVGGWDFAIEHVIQQDIRKGSFAFWRVKGSKVDTCVRKGLVGWREDCERAVTLQRVEELCLNNARNQ